MQGKLHYIKRSLRYLLFKIILFTLDGITNNLFLLVQSQVLKSQNGVIFSSPALVHRAMYTGRGIIAPNTQFTPGLVDHRGSLPVEWWIMSKTEAKNAIPVKNEGKAGKSFLLLSHLVLADPTCKYI